MKARRKHSIIPSSMRIQLKDLNNENLEIENVLCHLNVYKDSLSYYTYSFIPTNSSGVVLLTREEIIRNTELKHYYDDNLALDKEPVKFDFFILDQTILKEFISGLKGYLEIKPESIKEDLKRRGFNDEKIEKSIPIVIKKQKEDQELYEFLIQNKNGNLEYSEKNSKIIGYWNDISDYQYELKIKL